MLRILRELLEFTPQESGTDISEALRFLTNAIKKRCNAFLLSDLLDVDANAAPKYEEALKIAANRHDLSVIEIYDPRERDLPDVGLVRVCDAESGAQRWINTSSASVRKSYSQWNEKVQAEAEKLFRKTKVESVSISTSDDYVKNLISFFKRK